MHNILENSTFQSQSPNNKHGQKEQHGKADAEDTKEIKGKGGGV
jgi:hypothetical protein